MGLEMTGAAQRVSNVKRGIVWATGKPLGTLLYSCHSRSFDHLSTFVEMEFRLNPPP